MKNLIRKWLLKLLPQPQLMVKGKEGFCSVIYEQGFFFLTMPSGEKIPMQIYFAMEDNFPKRGLVTVTVKVNIEISEDLKKIHDEYIRTKQRG